MQSDADRNNSVRRAMTSNWDRVGSPCTSFLLNMRPSHTLPIDTCFVHSPTHTCKPQCIKSVRELHIAFNYDTDVWALLMSVVACEVVGVMWLSSLSSRSHGSWLCHYAHHFLQDPNCNACWHTFALLYDFGMQVSAVLCIWCQYVLIT